MAEIPWNFETADVLLRLSGLVLFIYLIILFFFIQLPVFPYTATNMKKFVNAARSLSRAENI
jgi:hypothetical protein